MGSAHHITQYGFIKAFSCLGAECEDTCCRGWGMQVDERTKSLYKKEAPELLEAVTTGEAELIMRRDPNTDYCVKFKDGLCSIHASRGDRFLGDACHFYPRISRSYGESVLMGATLSCPEITRLVLYGGAPFSLHEMTLDRLPYSMKDYLPDTLTEEGALKVIHTLVAFAGSEEMMPQRIMAVLRGVSESLRNIAPARWPDGVGVLTRMAEGRLPAPEVSPNDAYHLVNALAGLIYASKKTPRPRLEETFRAIETSLKISLDWETLAISQAPKDADSAALLEEKWQKGAEGQMAPVLRRWIQAQVAMAGFPFSGFGKDIAERITIMGVRFATIRLALMAHMQQDGSAPDEKTAVRVVQSVSRFLDHLADPTLSMTMYEEAEWTRESRFRALVGDRV